MPDKPDPLPDKTDLATLREKIPAHEKAEERDPRLGTPLMFYRSCLFATTIVPYTNTAGELKEGRCIDTIGETTVLLETLNGTWARFAIDISQVDFDEYDRWDYGIGRY